MRVAVTESENSKGKMLVTVRGRTWLCGISEIR